MLILTDQRLVYVGPPKTGSTTLHHWLGRPPATRSIWTPDREDQHDFAPAELLEAGYRLAVSHRNPMARAVSLWRHSLCDPLIPDYDLQAFCLWVACGGAPDFYSRPQADWLRPGCALLRLGRLEADLLDLLGAELLERLGPLPRLNPTTPGPWWRYLDRPTARMIRETWPADFH